MEHEHNINISIDAPTISGFTVYTKFNCKFCDLVKKLLHHNNFHAKIIPCDEYLCSSDLMKESFLAHINRKYIQQFSVGEHRTFPMVFFQGKFLGGYSDTVKHIHHVQEQEKKKPDHHNPNKNKNKKETTPPSESDFYHFPA
jgi:glutaredoxin